MYFLTCSKNHSLALPCFSKSIFVGSNLPSFNSVSDLVTGNTSIAQAPFSLFLVPSGLNSKGFPPSFVITKYLPLSSILFLESSS